MACCLNLAFNIAGALRFQLSSIRHAHTQSDEWAVHRALLGRFKGGTVTLNCDDKTGVATVTVDNIERKNALTGK